MYEYKAQCVKVVDGDTIDCVVDLGFKVNVGPERFRLYGIDAPETTLRGDTTPEEKAAGLELKAWLKERIEGKEVVLRTFKDDKGKYGRYLAVVIHDGVNLNEFMFEEGWVEAYIVG